jgi:hypothetical protein
MNQQMAQMKIYTTREINRLKNEMKSQMDEQISGAYSEMEDMQEEIDSLKLQLRMQEDTKFALVEKSSTSSSTRIDNWEYPLSIEISASYWIDRGFDLAYSRAVDELLRKIKCMTRDIRRGRYVHRIDLYVNFGAESENTILIQDDILLPHWRQLTDALKEYDYPEPPEYFYLSDVQLVPEAIDMLTRALAATNIKDVSIQTVDFVQESHGIDFATKTLQDNVHMRNFCWKNNRFSNIQQANDLVGAITNHPHLKAIDMSGCFNHGDHGHDILCRLLTRNKYERVRFRNNNVITSGSAHIPDYIATNPSLTHLNLQTNHLDDNDASLIARALKQNTKLKILCLGGNDITEVGINALKRSIFDPSSTLNSAASSNHTCRIRGIGLEEYFYDKFSTKKQIRVERYTHFYLEGRQTALMHITWRWNLEKIV